MTEQHRRGDAQTATLQVGRDSGGISGAVDDLLDFPKAAFPVVSLGLWLEWGLGRFGPDDFVDLVARRLVIPPVLLADQM
jgi:hypothetical protein